MKKQLIKTPSATVLVVEMPEGAKNVRVNNSRGIFGYTDKINIFRWEVLEFGNWQLIGRIPDITEDQWKGVVDVYDNGYFYYPDGYKDTCDTATESGLSLLQANEIYFDRHPFFPDKPNIEDYTTKEAHVSMFEIWQEAQSKVWDKERCYLFIKVD